MTEKRFELTRFDFHEGFTGTNHFMLQEIVFCAGLMHKHFRNLLLGHKSEWQKKHRQQLEA